MIHWSRISLICVWIMIWIRCRNVSVNILIDDGSLLSIHGSCYVDQVNFGHVFVNDLNAPYSFLSSQKHVQATRTGSRMRQWEGWVYFKMQFAGNVTVLTNVTHFHTTSLAISAKVVWKCVRFVSFFLTVILTWGEFLFQLCFWLRDHGPYDSHRYLFGQTMRRWRGQR